MSEINFGDHNSSTDGSDSGESVGSPAESVHSYVRSRPHGSAHVSFAPPQSRVAVSSSRRRAPRRSVTDRSPERDIFGRSPSRSLRHFDRSRREHRGSGSDRIRDSSSSDHVSPPRINRHHSRDYGPVYLDLYPDEHNPSLPPVISRNPDTYYPSDASIVGDDSEFSEPVTIHRRPSPISRLSRSRGREITRERLLEKIDYDWNESDDERSKVHHVINIHASRSADTDEMMKKWLAGRVFTHQSSFNEDEKTLPETYHVVQSRLVPRSEDDPHDRAILTYEEKAASSKTEIRWVYVSVPSPISSARRTSHSTSTKQSPSK